MKQDMFDSDVRAAFGVIEDLLNSSLLRNGSELLSSPAFLEQMRQRRSLSYRPAQTQAELVEIRQLRSRLEEFVRPGPLDERMALVNAMFMMAGSVPQLAVHPGDEVPHFHYTMADASFSAKVTALSAIGLARLLSTESVDRLRVCAGPDCEKAFIDVSKNGSRRYCDSQTCGNRLHAARYRARRTPTVVT